MCDSGPSEGASTLFSLKTDQRWSSPRNAVTGMSAVFFLHLPGGVTYDTAHKPLLSTPTS